MNIEDIVNEKIELETNIRDFIVEAIERFEEKTGLAPCAVNIHIGTDESIGRTKRHCVLSVEVIITI